MIRSPWLRVCCMRLRALLRLGFPPAPRLQSLGLAAHRNSQVYSTKDTPPPSWGCDILSVCGFRFCFTPLAGVLFAFPSRYLSAIGSCIVFSLGSWSTRIPAGFLVPRRTQDSAGVLATSATRLSRSPARLPRRLACRPAFFSVLQSYNPASRAVWAPPSSLAATGGISVDFFSRVT